MTHPCADDHSPGAPSPFGPDCRFEDAELALVGLAPRLAYIRSLPLCGLSLLPCRGDLPIGCGVDRLNLTVCRDQGAHNGYNAGQQRQQAGN
jgi:hypothetical protein